MLNLAVLIQLIGLVLSFTIGTAGYVAGPALIVIGALIYRLENQRRKLASLGTAPSRPQARFKSSGWNSRNAENSRGELREIAL